ncbi:DUF1727 domain-containing protein [Candidatus Curtissbacteria bacterium]|nr:DUF1727 domain-containing protein [Candidatus Curtissbacteria bacterium]
MDIKLFLALLLGKIIYHSLKIFKTSGGTAAPGLFALKIDINLVSKISRRLQSGNVLISGTNGKTTTSRMISDFLSKKFNTIHNRQGSNLMRGIASSIISKSTLSGALKEDFGIWEVDEAVLPEAIGQIRPKIVVILNLFRDQLDRYGEVDSTRKKWLRSISDADKSTTFILNADDPQVASLVGKVKGKKILFGISGKVAENLLSKQDVADIRYCFICANKLIYKTLYFSHLGIYECSNCSLKRPDTSVTGLGITKGANFSTKFEIKIGKFTQKINLPLPGIYNVYNTLAASAVADQVGLRVNELPGKLKKFSAAFGRFQRINIDGKNVIILLIKNPTGANEVLSVLKNENIQTVLTCLNDRLADGTDVSWIWDTSWEIITGTKLNIFCSGTRAWDIALRLKYANMSNITVHKEISYSYNHALNKTNKNNTLIVLPTYTALLELQKHLEKSGATKWHKQ